MGSFLYTIECSNLMTKVKCLMMDVSILYPPLLVLPLIGLTMVL